MRVVSESESEPQPDWRAIGIAEMERVVRDLLSRGCPHVELAGLVLAVGVRSTQLAGAKADDVIAAVSLLVSRPGSGKTLGVSEDDFNDAHRIKRRVEISKLLDTATGLASVDLVAELDDQAPALALLEACDAAAKLARERLA